MIRQKTFTVQIINGAAPPIPRIHLVPDSVESSVYLFKTPLTPGEWGTGIGPYLAWSITLNKYVIFGLICGNFEGPTGTGSGTIAEVVGTYTYQAFSCVGTHANTFAVTDATIP